MFRHSSTIRSGLNGHIKETHEEHTLHHHNAHFILAAEFDNKQGPIIKHQYPKSIPGFKISSNQSSTMNLASLMIPNSIESTPGRADFTVFILYKHKFKQTYQIFPITNSEEQENGSGTMTILEEDEGHSSPWKIPRDNHTKNPKEQPLFFVNVVSARRDTTNKRGAIIKSIALGTTMKKFRIFKPLLAMALDEYMHSNNDVRILIECFNMVNSLDLSLINRVHSNISLQNVLNSINDEDITLEIFDVKGRCLRSILNVNELPKTDCFGNKITFKQHHIEYQFSSFTPTVLPSTFVKIPLQIDMVDYDSIKVDINYNDHVLKFLRNFIPELCKRGLSASSWRLFVNSTKETKDTLCQFVISLSMFLKCFDFQYFDNAHLIIFPYMDISFIDEFRIEFPNNRSGLYFSVVGVSNPIFEYQHDVWDFYYDMDHDSLLTQSDVAPNSHSSARSIDDLTKNKTFKKMFQKNNSSGSLITSKPSRTSLMSKLINYLVDEQHDNETILNVLKRINTLQLLHLLQIISQRKSNDSELILKDEYIITYKDFIIFPEFFEYSSLNVLRSLHELELSLNAIIFSRREKYSPSEKGIFLKRALSSLKSLYKYVSINKTNMANFLNICLNYPVTQLLYSFDPIRSDFGPLDLKREFKKLKESDSVEGLSVGSAKVIDYFMSERSLRLLCLPLLLNVELDYEASNFSDSTILHSQFSHTRNENKMAAGFWQSDGSMSNFSSLYEESTDQAVSYDAMSTTFSFRDDTTTSSSRKEGDGQVNKIKKIAVKLLYRIEKHDVGSLLLKDRLNPMFRAAYNTLKEDLFDHESVRTSLADNFAQVRLKQDSPQTVSPKRQELLEDLDSILEKQETIRNQQPKIQKAVRPSILDALNQIAIPHKNDD
ncbi:LAFE_0F03884g1_1 [Lachancea fermentati]|uniref:LAFE_0F03884g1_1 n=1 Tax=Lachancea fermentati TaxID=4955 RepID=A0A1G4MEP2_LACFM|nr:LAFE_0F03884g1_1 [Lachancea fermentati]